MDDYISRQAAFDAFNKLDYDICSSETFDNLHGYYGFSEETINQTINNIPTANVKNIAHGDWEWRGPCRDSSGRFWATCSVCGVRQRLGDYENFCQNCGADMRGNKSER